MSCGYASAYNSSTQLYFLIAIDRCKNYPSAITIKPTGRKKIVQLLHGYVYQTSMLTATKTDQLSGFKKKLVEKTSRKCFAWSETTGDPHYSNHQTPVESRKLSPQIRKHVRSLGISKKNLKKTHHWFFTP